MHYLLLREQVRGKFLMHQLLLGAETKTEKKEEKAEKVFYF